jgi:hypothetical protein
MDARWTQVCLQTFLVLGALTLSVASAENNDTVWCYQCNSAYHGANCAAEGGVGQLKPFLASCGVAEPPFTRCRTMIQTVEGDTRTIRSCATAGTHGDADRCMDRVGTARVKVRYCECPEAPVPHDQTTDKACNEAPRRAAAAQGTLAAAALLAALGLAGRV